MWDLQQLEEKSEPLEHGAVPEADGVVDDQLIVPMRTRKIGPDDVGYVAHPAAQSRIVEYVHDGSRRIGDFDADLPAPYGARTEELSLWDDAEAKRRPLDLDVRSAHLLRGDDDDAAEHLLCQLPVLARTPTTDVARCECLICDNPRVNPPLAWIARLERHRAIEPTMHAYQPPTSRKVRKKTLGSPTRQSQDGGRVRCRD